MLALFPLGPWKLLSALGGTSFGNLEVPYLKANVEAEDGHTDRVAMGHRLYAWDSVLGVTLFMMKDYTPLKSG